MKLIELLDLVNEAYSDDFITLEGHYTRAGKLRHKRGDLLARFIVEELIETFDPGATNKAQRAEAARVLRSAIDDLERTCEELEA